MRALAVVLAVAATVSLSGCFWWADEFDDGSDGSDGAAPEVAFVLLGGAVIVGIVLVAINLSSQGGSRPPVPPPQPLHPPQPPSNAGWQEVDVLEERGPGAVRAPPPARSAPKQARRRAP